MENAVGDGSAFMPDGGHSPVTGVHKAYIFGWIGNILKRGHLNRRHGPILSFAALIVLSATACISQVIRGKTLHVKIPNHNKVAYQTTV